MIRRLRSALAGAACALALVASAACADELSAPRLAGDDGSGLAERGSERRADPSATPQAANPLAGPVDPALYRVGPGDVLLLHVRGGISRDISIEVGPEGTILLPDDGLVYVSGHTLAQVRKDVLDFVSRRYRNVVAQLRLARPRTFRIYLTGMVRETGPTAANGSFRVADVVSDSMLLAGASRRGIELVHIDGSRDTCDLDRFLLVGSAIGNPWLRDGDVVNVPTASRFLYAEGAVARSGRYELGARDSVSTLIQLAGNLLPAAITDRMLLVRFQNPVTPESLWISLEGIREGRQNFPLRDGDRLYVYFVPKFHEQQEAFAYGEIQRPGGYPIAEGRTRLSQLVTAAQGFQPAADLSTIRVHRVGTASRERDPELDRLLRLSRNELTSSEYELLRAKLAGLREDFRVDWTRLQAHPDLDLLLLDGDIVTVNRLVSSIRVDGEVRRPGMLNYVAGESVNDCIQSAGGFTDRAWRGKVRVTRAITGQTLLARNVSTLDPGDLVWVPERPDRTGWEQLRDVLGVLAQAATVIIAIKSIK